MTREAPGKAGGWHPESNSGLLLLLSDFHPRLTLGITAKEVNNVQDKSSLCKSFQVMT